MKKYLLFIFFLFYFSTSVFGQITVSGRVINNTGEPIIGFIIKVKDTLQGTVTDAEGKFEIEVKDENTILVFERHNNEPLEIKASDVKGDVFIYKYSNLLICRVVGVPITQPLRVNYWSGLRYNPYGIEVSKGWHSIPLLHYFSINTGYSTDFRKNSDFFGAVGLDLFRRTIFYRFQQTTFHKSEIENKISTHVLESNSNLKFIKTNLSYGIGYQKFSKKALKSSEMKNYGIHLGLSKSIKYLGTISAKSFYWQDYYAWEANLNKSIYYRKLRLNTAISYRQTTHHFKEVNLTLGYRF